MEERSYYIPYKNNLPAGLDINGHTVFLVATDREQLEEGLALIGAEEIFEAADELSVEEAFCEVGNPSMVVVTPEELSVDQVVFGLRHTLPWPH